MCGIQDDREMRAKDEIIQADAWRQLKQMADVPFKDSNGKTIREGLKDAGGQENNLTDEWTYKLIELMVTG
jgi:hypothetical protein